MSYSFYPKIVLPVKRNLQDTPYDCGPASILIILQTLGIDINEASLMKLGHCTSDKGTSPESLKKILNHFRVKFEEFINSSISDIDHKIKTLNLCLIDYQAWPLGNDKQTLNSGHYSVVFGISPHHLWIADPAKHHTQTYSKWGARKIRKDIFLKDWIDMKTTGEINNRWMISVPLYQKFV